MAFYFFKKLVYYVRKGARIYEDFFLFIAILLTIFGVKTVVEWIIRKITNIAKSEESDQWVNRLHQNLHLVLTLSFIIFYFLNDSDRWIDSSLLILIFVFTLFTHHTIMQYIFLKKSKEYIVSFLTGICLTGIASLWLCFIG